MISFKYHANNPINPVSAPAGAHRLARRTWLAQAGALTLAACGGGSETPDAPPAPVCLRTLVPAYFYKAAPWAELTAGKQPTVIIANASNGPGSRLDTQDLAWINAARTAGHRVKGYVYSGYGQRAISAVLADLAAWTQFYGVSDYFIDEASSTTADLPYYRDLLTAAAAAQSGRRFMLNPGTAPAIAYFGLAPNLEILVFENAWSTYTSTSLPTTLDAVASQCWLMALSASEADMLQAAAVARNRRFAGFFATNLPFTTGLPTYWARQTALAVCA
jgi:hypothetical protein